MPHGLPKGLATVPVLGARLLGAGGPAAGAEPLPPRARRGGVGGRAVPLASLAGRALAFFAGRRERVAELATQAAQDYALLHQRHNLEHRGKRHVPTRGPHFLRVRPVQRDGRCMFRALAIGCAKRERRVLTEGEEAAAADELRTRAAGALCGGDVADEYAAALNSVHAEYRGNLKKYCRDIREPQFWGGYSELVVLAKMLEETVVVFVPHKEVGGSTNGFIPIVCIDGWRRAGRRRKALKLLYSGAEHYDLLE